MTARALFIAIASLVLILGADDGHAQPTEATADPTDWQGQLERAEELRRKSPRSEANERAVSYWYRKAASSGASQALLQAGCYFYARRTKANQEEARGMIRQAAALGDPDAKLALAKFVALGIGGPQIEQTALKLIREAYEIYRDPVTIAAIAKANAAAKSDPRLADQRLWRRIYISDCGPPIQEWAKQRGIMIEDMPGVDGDRFLRVQP
jgi:TPR repeat protein